MLARQIHTCGIIHKGLNEESTPYINNMFNLSSNTDGVTTRSEIRGDLKLRKTRLGMSEGNIAIRGAKYYNEIPVEARGINSNKSFVRKLTRIGKYSIELD